MDTRETAEIGSTGLRVTRLGFGGAPLGGLVHPVDDGEAVRTVRRAIELGVSYVDTAPLYGSGRSERLVGEALSALSGDDFVLSTKVGRLLEPVEDSSAPDRSSDLPPMEPVFDYSRDGVLRSVEDSLERTGLDRVDVLYVHDPDEGRSVDDLYESPGHYRQVIDEALPALVELRSQGVIKAVGVGMNGWQMLAQFARDGDFDCFLLAGRYTLLDQSALPTLLPCARAGT